MKNKNIFLEKCLNNIFPIMFILFCTISCNDDILDEKPLSFLNSDVVLVNPAGFESAIAALHQGVREKMYGGNNYVNSAMWGGTDFWVTSEPNMPDWRDIGTTLTSVYSSVEKYWEWAYLIMLPRANTIIEYAEKPNVKWDSEDQKNAIIAEARFLRAYAYNVLANLYGGVPIVEKVEKSPKLDYTRNTREEVLALVKSDLVYASQWLPETTNQSGRIVKAAADHLLAEVNINLGKYDEAISSASDVINSGLYHLMTERFGKYKADKGDVFRDLFLDGNQNRSSGNMESIWVMQFEYQTPGGAPTAGGNYLLRCWGARYYQFTDPNSKSGMILSDSLGRGVGWYDANNYFYYDIWKNDWNDMRNSKYNIRRQWYYNNPSSAYYLKPVEKRSNFIDTTYRLHKQILKIEGEKVMKAGASSGNTFTDWMIFRLAETYLLRAEAYHLKGDNTNAAADINIVRSRANAPLITANEVSMDFILDERLRELVIEEDRRLTLARTGKFIERVKKYNGNPVTVNSFKDHHVWFPIPQKAIDANLNAVLEQNDGY